MASTQNSAGKWPGWPGYSVFRLVVPQGKVGKIIGKNGDVIKNMVQQTGARIRVLDGPVSCPDRIVLISGKENPESALPPAIDAIIRIFKLLKGDAAICSARLLVANTQAISLIGKRRSIINSIIQTTSASVHVLPIADELSVYAISDERVIQLQGEAINVLKALEAVVGHLRKFLVDQSVLPCFEKDYTQETQADDWTSTYPIPVERESPTFTRQFFDTSIGMMQIVHTMGISAACADMIIGVEGITIDYIQRISGARLSFRLSEIGVEDDEMILEIKGTSSQVQEANRLIQVFTGGWGLGLGSFYAPPGSGSSSSVAGD